MIHHLSIAAREPQRVAEVFAELLGGACVPFPPNPGAFMAIAGDRHGTAVEVHPADTELKPNGPVGAEFLRSGRDPALSAVHFAMSVDRSRAEIEAIAGREGWPCFVCDRGGDFGVIELWVESRFLVEVLPPDFAAQYLNFAGLFVGAESPAALMSSHARLTPA